MKALNTYHIRFNRRGETKTQVRQFPAADAGHAFAKCLRKYSGCILLEGWREEKLPGGGEICHISYAPPSTIRIVAEPTPVEKQTYFGFLEEISWNHPKKQECAATSPILQPKFVAQQNGELP